MRDRWDQVREREREREMEEGEEVGEAHSLMSWDLPH